jgi:hypothetical protein
MFQLPPWWNKGNVRFRGDIAHPIKKGKKDENAIFVTTETQSIGLFMM